MLTFIWTWLTTAHISNGLFLALFLLSLYAMFTLPRPYRRMVRRLMDELDSTRKSLRDLDAAYCELEDELEQAREGGTQNTP